MREPEEMEETTYGWLQSFKVEIKVAPQWNYNSNRAAVHPEAWYESDVGIIAGLNGYSESLFKTSRTRAPNLTFLPFPNVYHPLHNMYRPASYRRPHAEPYRSGGPHTAAHGPTRGVQEERGGYAPVDPFKASLALGIKKVFGRTRDRTIDDVPGGRLSGRTAHASAARDPTHAYPDYYTPHGPPEPNYYGHQPIPQRRPYDPTPPSPDDNHAWYRTPPNPQPMYRDYESEIDKPPKRQHRFRPQITRIVQPDGQTIPPMPPAAWSTSSILSLAATAEAGCVAFQVALKSGRGAKQKWEHLIPWREPVILVFPSCFFLSSWPDPFSPSRPISQSSITDGGKSPRTRFAHHRSFFLPPISPFSVSASASKPLPPQPSISVRIHVGIHVGVDASGAEPYERCGTIEYYVGCWGREAEYCDARTSARLRLKSMGSGHTVIERTATSIRTYRDRVGACRNHLYRSSGNPKPAVEHRAGSPPGKFETVATFGVLPAYRIDFSGPSLNIKASRRADTSHCLAHHALRIPDQGTLRDVERRNRAGHVVQY
ncbi:hypothetical protein NMY22_g2000 [Coprinellus aureogranulatus]|nr:hypothetical protein NMY22_g2000 [Coprinellus aureogranulatus]